MVERDGAEQMDAGKFLNLVNRCGLQLKEVELAKLTSRELLVPWKGRDGTTGYTGLHLYVVAEYFRMASPVRHPWEKDTAPPEVEDVAELSVEVNRVLDAAWGDADISQEDVEEFMVGVERCLARHDPFGPLGAVFDLLRPEVVARMRNAGRLYLELKMAVSRLSRGLDGVAVRGADPKTRPMFGDDTEVSITEGQDLRATTIIDDRGSGASNATETSEAAQDAIDEVVLAAEQSRASEEEVVGEAAEDDADKVRDRRPGRTTQVIEVEPELEEQDRELGDEDSEPVVLLEEEVEELDDDVEELTKEADDADGFAGAEPMTKRTKALNERLEQLSEHDRQRRGSDDESAEETKADEMGAVPPPSPAERIDELNKRREIYMKEKNWEELVELYEEGIGLFTDPGERQQIFLVLAMLYEVKLRDKESAFDAFGRAWREREGTRQGRHKAWEGLQRLSKSSGLHQRYLDWLEEQLASSTEPAQRIRMQKELALGLFADQQFERAFDSYASFVVEEPERFVSEDTLSQLERLGEHVDDEKVGQCFDELREAELEPELWELIDEFAPEVSV